MFKLFMGAVIYKLILALCTTKLYYHNQILKDTCNQITFLGTLLPQSASKPRFEKAHRVMQQNGVTAMHNIGMLKTFFIQKKKKNIRTRELN